MHVKWEGVRDVCAQHLSGSLSGRLKYYEIPDYALENLQSIVYASIDRHTWRHTNDELQEYIDSKYR